MPASRIAAPRFGTFGEAHVTSCPIFAMIRSAFIRCEMIAWRRLSPISESGKIMAPETWRNQQMTQPAMAPDLQPVWQIMTAFQLSYAYKAAIELELFTKIGEGNKTAAALASDTGSAERGVRILADVLTVVGLLEKSGDEYSNTDVSAFFLDKNSPAYVGSAVEFIMVSPPPQALFALIMLAATPGGDAYTFAELKDMFESAGLTKNENIALSPMPQNLIIS